jgi:hypothetical protein
MEAYKVVRFWDPTFATQLANRWRLGYQPYVAAMLYPPQRSFISVRGLVNLQVIVQLEGLGKLKISMTSGLELITF